MRRGVIHSIWARLFCFHGTDRIERIARVTSKPPSRAARLRACGLWALTLNPTYTPIRARTHSVKRPPEARDSRPNARRNAANGRGCPAEVTRGAQGSPRAITAPRVRPSRPLRRIDNSSLPVTAIEGVPYFYSQFARLVRRLKSLRLQHLGIGGGAIDRRVMQEILAVYPEVTVSVR